jgi:thioredoxin reductase (NADPH)
MAYKSKFWVGSVVSMATVLLGCAGCFFLQTHKPHKTVHLDYSLEKALAYENVAPIAIIGSGPSGLSASLYIARAGMKAFVFGGADPLGQLTKTTYIENWPGVPKILGSNVMHTLQEQAESFGACMINDIVTEIKADTWPFVIKTEEGREFRALAIILCMGASPKTLGVPGEQEYWGSGVTTCAICDAPFFKNKDVVVVGGGDSAAEEVFQLAPYVKSVTMLVRKDHLRAAPAIKKRVEAIPNAKIEYNVQIKQIYGDDSGHVHAIDVLNNKTNQVEKRPIDGVFLAVGHTPNVSIVKDFLDTDELGYLVMQGRSQQTSLRGIFAAGEVQDHTYRQAGVAAGQGICAALDAINFLYDLGFNSSISAQLDEQFFEAFSDKKLALQEINTLAEFNKYIAHSKGITVLDFYGKVCPECTKLKPALEAVAFKMQDKVKMYCADQHISKEIIYELVGNYKVKLVTLPTVIVFRDGQPIDTMTKAMSKTEFYNYMKQFVQESE